MHYFFFFAKTQNFMAAEFKAIVVSENESGSFSKQITKKNFAELPQHDTLVRVNYAALNFKDALSASGHKGITRRYPHTPGVDAAGVVEECSSGKFKKGNEVIVTSFDLGMNTSGGFAEYIRVPSEWIVAKPKEFTLKQSMILGTAAFTAGMALYKMEKCGQNPAMGPVVVTGASGGVGSLAVAILARAGYEVIASSGKKDEYDFLKELGATTCVGREFTDDKSGKPVLKSLWAGAIDNVGGNTLVTLLKGCKKEGSVACIGLVDSPKIEMTVYPFILNGVNLLGIDSAEFEMKKRIEVWNYLATKWNVVDKLEKISTVCTLEEIPAYMELMLKGKTKGRIVAEL
jgi:acrylyl-CoA reductase (NADPH)